MKKTSLARDISGVFGSNVLAIISALLMGVIVARYLGPEGKGLFTALTGVPVIVASFAAMGIRRTAVYFIGKKEFNESEVASAVIQILIITSLAGMGASYIAFHWMDNSSYTLELILITILIIPFRLATIYAGGIYLGREQFRFANLMKWSVPMVNLLLLVVFVIILEMDVAGALLAVMLSGVIISVVAIAKLSKDFKLTLKWNRILLKRMLSLGTLYAGSLLVMKLIYRIDVLLLEQLSDLKEVGYYSIAVTISEQLWQLPLAVGIVIMSKSANAHDPALMNKKVGQMLRFSLFAGAAGAVVMYFIMPFLIPLIYGKAFSESATLLQTILPGIVFFIIFRILNSHLNGLGKPLPAIYAIIPALALNIGLNYLWIPEFGGKGAAMATNVSYVFGTVLMIVFYIRATKAKAAELLLPQREDMRIIMQKLKGRKR
ncbi:MAG TPA: flippase [Bacteroidales bacterium]|nr:flippase [Bacteroidales bacterium]